MNLMIDLETLGIHDKCPVVSLGAVLFDENGIRKLPGSQFKVILNVEDQLQKGRTIDYGTIQWWMSQSDEARKIFEKKPDFWGDNKRILLSFSSYVKKFDNVKVWGNGATFDISILENLYRTYELNVPWHFRNVRDMRTLVEIVGVNKKIKRQGIHHNALDDALYQAKICAAGLKKLKKAGF